MNTYSSSHLLLYNFCSVHNRQVIMSGNNLLGSEMSVLIPECILVVRRSYFAGIKCTQVNGGQFGTITLCPAYTGVLMFKCSSE
jgi:hypothetical protein